MIVDKAEGENLWVDLSWLKGTARIIISNTIQQRAVDNGWHRHTTDHIQPCCMPVPAVVNCPLLNSVRYNNTCSAFKP